MELIIRDAKTFCTLVDIINEIINGEKAGFIIDKNNGLSLATFDQGKSTLIVWSADKDAFEKFEVKNDSTVLNISFDSLNKILKRCGKTKQLTLLYDEEAKGNQLKVVLIEGENKRTFSIGLSEVLEGENNPTKIATQATTMLKLQYEAVVTMPTKILNDIIKDLEIVADRFTMYVESKMARFTATSPTKNNVDIEYSLKEDGESEPCNVSAEFLLKNFKKFLKLSTICEHTELGIGLNKPIRLAFSLGGGNQFTLVLAPAPVESEADEDFEDSEKADTPAAEGTEETEEEVDEIEEENE